MVVDISAKMDTKTKAALKSVLRDFVDRYQGFSEHPRRVVVSRPSPSPYDDRIVAVVKGVSGRYLGTITGDRNGAGTLLVSPLD